MPKRGELFKAAIEDNDSTQALYLTCLYVIRNQINYLEDEWISMASHVGKKEDMPFAKTWGEVNTDIFRLIEKEEFHIQEALLCTTKLMLINQRDATPHIKSHVQHLRNAVIGCFPDKAMLSPAGKDRFGRILPAEDNELYAFYNRILAGFSKIIGEGRYNDMRDGLEFISRKRLALPLSNAWPAINQTEADAGDPCWFLWGMILLVYSDNKNVATNFKLFCSNWRKNVRNERIGLLWGIPYLIDDYSDLLWTPHELSIFEKVRGATTELWNFALNENKKEMAVEESKKDSEFEPTEKKSLETFFESFVPRKSPHLNETSLDYLVESINTNMDIDNPVTSTRVIQLKIKEPGSSSVKNNNKADQYSRIKKIDAEVSRIKFES
jgi:hypothetical protein